MNNGQLFICHGSAVWAQGIPKRIAGVWFSRLQTSIEFGRSGWELAAGSEFTAARPGVSRHLRILREHGLVRSRVDGRRRGYSLDPGPLDELDAWLMHYRAFWQNRLDALDTEVKRQRRST